MKKILLILLLIPCMATAYNGRPITVDSLPLLLNTDDSVYFTDLGDTLKLNTSVSSLTLDNRTFYYGIFGINNTSNIYIDLSDKVFLIDTGYTGTDNQCGIAIKGNTAGAVYGVDSIIISDGVIIRDEGGGSDNGSGMACIATFQTMNVQINNVDLTIDGQDGVCLWSRRVMKNFDVTNGTWACNSNSFTDRQWFICGGWYCYNTTNTDSIGRPTVRGVNITNTPHMGFSFETKWDAGLNLRPQVISCTVNVDAQNQLYDTLACFTTGTCATGQSSANAYGIRLSYTGAGSKIDSCIITSGTSFSGGRGALVENSKGTVGDPIIVSNNYFECHNGPDGENVSGVTRTMRLRSLDSRYWNQVNITDNIFVSIVDNDPLTTGVGTNSSTLQFGVFQDGDSVEVGSILRNTVIARSMDATGTNATAGEYFHYDGANNDDNMTIGGNHYYSSETVVRFSDDYNGWGASNITLSQDTFSYIDAGDSGVIGDTLTFYIGEDLFNSVDLNILEGVYSNNAMDSSVTFHASNNQEIAYSKIVTTTIQDNMSQPLENADVWIVNNYGDTVSKKTTNASGQTTDTVTYRYEGDLVDSLGFNAFTIGTQLTGDTTVATSDFAWDNSDTTLTLGVYADSTTYYVSATGNDGNDGLSWSTAWATISKVNATVTGGDTVFFGTGIFRDTTLLPQAGTYDDRTVYACSSYADTNGSGEYHFAKIYGSDLITGWTLFSGNVYRATWTGPAGTDYELFQDDSASWLQSSLANVDAPGEHFDSSGYLYTWVYGGDDPDNYNMETSDRNIVYMGGADHVTFYGLEFKYAHTAGIYNYNATSNDSLFIERCKFSTVKGWAGVNPALISSSKYDAPNTNQYIKIRACSLSNVWAYKDATQPYLEVNTHGVGIVWYSVGNYVVDSNVFYDHFSMGGFYHKSNFFGIDPPDSNGTIAYNTFINTSGFGVATAYNIINLQIYGNYFNGMTNQYNNESAIRIYWSATEFDGGHKIYNNTIINCDRGITHAPQDSDIPYKIDNCEFKYNVVYNTGDLFLAMSQADTLSGGFLLDSNLYYLNAGSNDFKLGTYCIHGTNYGDGDCPEYFDTTSWTTKGFDSNSLFSTDPQFNDTANGDYSRPLASNEMDLNYGGQDWTIFGALQNAEATVTKKYIRGVKMRKVKL